MWTCTTTILVLITQRVRFEMIRDGQTFWNFMFLLSKMRLTAQQRRRRGPVCGQVVGC